MSDDTSPGHMIVLKTDTGDEQVEPYRSEDEGRPTSYQEEKHVGADRMRNQFHQCSEHKNRHKWRPCTPLHSRQVFPEAGAENNRRCLRIRHGMRAVGRMRGHACMFPMHQGREVMIA